MKNSTDNVVRVVIVGCGDRGMIYGREAFSRRGRFRIVGVAEPDPARRAAAAAAFGLPPERCMARSEDVARQPKFADAVFNCTMDALHVETSLPLLRRGYDMLLEKPIAPTRDEAKRLLACADETGRTVMVCHVLRYAPFYAEIKRRVLGGDIGRVVTIQMAEQVSYFHSSVAYVRGKYADPEICGSGLLLSKCSHDLDLMAWLLEGNLPSAVYSAGSVLPFRPENAPPDAPARCLPGCPHLATCPYSAPRLYIDHPQRWARRVWNDCGLADADAAAKLASLRDPANPYGRCVYRTGLKIVDHQSVLIAFADGATGTFTVTGGAAHPGRTIHIVGTKGEIEGCMEEQAFVLSTIDPAAPGGRTAERVDVSAIQKGDAHGGGDARILDDFHALLTGRKPSICCTSLASSIVGHDIVYAAEEFREARLCPAGGRHSANAV